MGNVWCSLKDALPLGATEAEHRRQLLSPRQALSRVVPPLPRDPRRAAGGGGIRGAPHPGSTPAAAPRVPARPPPHLSDFPSASPRGSSHLLNAVRRGQPPSAWTRRLRRLAARPWLCRPHCGCSPAGPQGSAGRTVRRGGAGAGGHGGAEDPARGPREVRGCRGAGRWGRGGCGGVPGARGGRGGGGTGGTRGS